MPPETTGPVPRQGADRAPTGKVCNDCGGEIVLRDGVAQCINPQPRQSADWVPRAELHRMCVERDLAQADRDRYRHALLEVEEYGDGYALKVARAALHRNDGTLDENQPNHGGGE